jgi:hypothetical protein
MQMVGNIFKRKANKLTFAIQKKVNDGYSTINKIREKSIDNINKLYNKGKFDIILLISKFNNQYYSFFDVDNDIMYNGLCETLDENKYNYVCFRSSENHYWVLVDKPFRNLKRFLNDDTLYPIWSVYSDPEFARISLEQKKMLIRGIFGDFTRQPIIIKKSKTLSNNFTIFITKLEKYYNQDAIKFSALRFKDTELLNTYLRTEKLKRILDE